MLNLNKFIKPDFANFRVTEVYKEPDACGSSQMIFMKTAVTITSS